ncbi:VOC family protein [Pseudalkalibacillus hwajinpoensis]|uniref:Glyoxalase/bleomycin resistance/extradiol dioxygenase family protein n=1 Tax=Guptibacillus hwajinpoensis TaxID=208199 RepID=A0A4U1MPD2_9BACL|nr:VOC family protein [Pseudalkalibacillus hwajinpoensis]TKD72380.1 glyoxalase/bleomycin resistance/extradiol dioxygenase family protein [Pseudalkalibacillus hwajinpoensis]
MGFQSDQLFVNLPVKNLKETVAFFNEIGFEFNPQFTDDNAACMIINQNTFVMLLVEEYFKTFTKKEITDATTTTEAIFAISATSREHVDEIVKKALEAGGKESKEPVDYGFMYGWSFQDINNHLWEVMYMDENEAQQA